MNEWIKIKNDINGYSCSGCGFITHDVQYSKKERDIEFSGKLFSVEYDVLSLPDYCGGCGEEMERVALCCRGMISDPVNDEKMRHLTQPIAELKKEVAEIKEWIKVLEERDDEEERSNRNAKQAGVPAGQGNEAGLRKPEV